MDITSRIKSILKRRSEASEARRLRANLDEHNSTAVEKFPELTGFCSVEKKISERIATEHDDYTRNISSEKMALSLNCATLLGYLVQETKPPRILDLGSGFSSYVLRRFSAEYGGVVFSVDDNKDWLEKTRFYLEAKGTSSINLEYWDDFIQRLKGCSDKEQFDLVFHDLGSMETRKDTLAFVVGLAKPGGIVILDDMHKSHYFKFVEGFLSANPMQYAHLEKLLLDNHGRWSTVLRKS